MNMCEYYVSYQFLLIISLIFANGALRRCFPFYEITVLIG